MDLYVKILIFLFLFLFILPTLTGLCCYFPTLRHVFFAGMLYFTSNEYSINLIPMPDWRGTARGYAFTAVSFFAVPLLMSMILSPKYKIRFFPPGTFFYFLYFLAILLSGYNAVHMHQWGFEVFKMFWMYITFLAAFNYMNNCKDLTFFAYIVSAILIILFLVGFDQKYRGGMYQIRSTFPHQNSLSLYLEVFGLVILGILMNEQIGRILFAMTLFAFGGSVLLVIFTYSRGGLVIYFGGIAIVCALSILINGFSVRRLTLMLIGMIVMLSVVGYALPRIILRFTKAPEASKNTRIVLAIASKQIANDYRLGVGANNYSEYSGSNYEYTLQPGYTQPGERGGIVETIYLLVAAECGWYGLALLLLWFLYYYLSVIVSMFALRKKPCCGIAIGLFSGLTCIYWHSSLEWSLKQYNNFAGQMVLYALIGVLAVNRKHIKAAYLRSQQKKALLKGNRRAVPVTVAAIPEAVAAVPEAVADIPDPVADPVAAIPEAVAAIPDPVAAIPDPIAAVPEPEEEASNEPLESAESRETPQ